MPYTAITPFRTAVQRIVERDPNTAPPDYPSPSDTFRDGEGRAYTVNWYDPHVEVLDYQGGDANNPEGKRDTKEQFVSVTELPDSSQGHYLSGRPTGRLEVTEQMDIWHQWRVAVDQLADIICRELDGRSIQLADNSGIGTIRVGVRSVLQEASSRMWRLSQRFIVTGHD